MFELTIELNNCNARAARLGGGDELANRLLHDSIRAAGFSRWRYSVSVTTECLSCEEFLFIKKRDAYRFARQHRRAGMGAEVFSRIF